MNTVRHIRTICMIFALLVGATTESWAALEKSNIIIDGGTRVGETFEYTIDHGSVTVKDVSVETRTVTITVTPEAGYSIQKSDIVVQKLADPAVASAPRRAPDIADPLVVSGLAKSKSATDYTFVVPADYAGALVTVTFRQLLTATVPVTPNSLTYTGSPIELVTLGTVMGTQFDSGTKLAEDAPLAGYYTKTDDVYTPCSADDQADGETTYYKPLVTYSDTEDGEYSSTIPTRTYAGTYTVFYKYVADDSHADGSGSVTVVIGKASITSVSLKEYVKKHTGSAVEFSLVDENPVNAGEISVPSSDYAVSGDALTTQTAVGTYTCTVTANPTSTNFTGSAFVNFRIVAANTVFIDSNSSPNEMDGTYVLTEDISASVLANLYSTTVDFTGELDGNFHKITDLSGHALFNTVKNGVVKNIILDNVSISGGTNVGAICNEATGDTRIYNCGILATNSTVEKDDDGYDYISSYSTISGSGYVGSIVGLLDGSSRVINCFSYANVNGGSEAGGIVGHNNVATTATNLKTMVMNCMFYGEVSGSSIAPIYNGEIITNVGKDTGVSNFNYFHLESSYIQDTEITKVYNCALGAETRFLQRFEFYRHLLNSHRELAGWWATGTYSKNDMAKWVLEPSQIGTSTPYPILKPAGYYPSVVNIDAENATTQTERNKGGKLGTLTVNIQMGSGGAVFTPPTGAAITTSSLTLNITDKDFDHYNFNYYKVQLPYYNDVGTKNYTGNRVVTGWKIVSITGGTPGEFTTGADASTDDSGNITSAPYNFADRYCTNKDLYGSGGSNRVFSQGAYWDVPEGVTAITIEPYWAKAAYLTDANADVVYNENMGTAYPVPNVGGGTIYTNKNSYPIAGDNQIVYTNLGDAVEDVLKPNTSYTVNDYAVVLVGNYHHVVSNNTAVSGSRPYTVTSVDLDGDDEPDYSLILRNNGRNTWHPVKWDFINIPGLGMAQKSTGANATGSYNLGIVVPKGWFETTNTSLFRVTQFEYSRKSSRSIAAPYILQGGVMEQWVTGQNNVNEDPMNITYFHLGGNVWFKEFHRGTHQDNTGNTNHTPISVTGGDFDKFYLTGLYRADVTSYGDNAECYINGGRFGEVAGAAMEGIGKANGADDTGNITWQIQNADIKEFYGGGINAASGHTVTGNISTTITGGKIDLFCGGPKFGDMSTGKTVTTTATGCEFGTFFGAGYGGSSYSRRAPRNIVSMINMPAKTGDNKSYNSWNAWVEAEYKQQSATNFPGISTRFDYQFIPNSGNADNVGRLFVEHVLFSLATTRNVTSTLTNCIVTGSFYGGGSLGMVDGPVTSTLTNCNVLGNVFGGGYSASLPTVEVDSIGFKTEPYYYTDLGTYRIGVKDETTTYTWAHGNSISIDKDNKILYTTENLDGLGVVTGKATLTINGTTTVAKSVYGGGEESVVEGNTEVIITSGTIGAAGQGGVEYGNVYGGGKGKNDDVKAGLVKGSTQVTISQEEGKTTTVYHNVYGGGAYGSVGDFDYDETTGMPTGLNTGAVDNSGNTLVEIKGGTIGWNGKENGMVFGSSRGDVDAPEDLEDRKIVEKMAWVNDAEVKIGTLGQGFNAPQPQIKGSVYGGGENGHNFNNAEVYIYSGTIGIAEGSEIVDKNGTPNDDTDDKHYVGAEYPYRGNVYGGGCGTDKYYSDIDNIPTNQELNDGNGDEYNPLAGIVRGNATVTISGGHVVRNVYGAGAMGSVGTADVVASGTTTINISGGQIGVSGTVGDGNVFGAARGSAEATSNEYALVRNTTTVNIGGKASVKGNVYGGGELGCVGRYTISADMRNFYWTDLPSASIDPANPATYTYNNTGVCNVNITGGTIGTGVEMSDDGSFTNGNVFGASKGKDDTFWCEKGIVYKANVSITDGTVNGNVYGGGEVGRVETDATVKIGPDTGIGSPDVKGNVFGAGAGVETHGYSALVRGNTYVTIQSSAKVGESVYGGGKIAAVGKYYLVNQEYLDTHPGTKLEIGMPYSLVSDELGICTVNVKGKAQIGYKGTGHVFGAGKGQEPEYYLGNIVSYTNRTNMPRRMMSYNPALYNDEEDNPLKDLWEYTDASEKYVWEYFDTKAKYYTFLETLGLVTQTDLTIGGEATVSGNVYGGSESGFVQHNVKVKLQESCVIGTTTTGGNVFGGGLGLDYFSEAGRVSGNTDVTIIGGTACGNVYGGGSLGDVGTINKADIKNYKWTDEANPGDTYTYNDTGVCNVTITGGTIGVDNPEKPDEHGNVFGGGMGLADNFWCEKAMVYTTNVSIKKSGTTVKGSVFGGGQVGRVEDDVKVEIGTENGSDEPEITGDVFGAGKGLKTHGYSALTRGNVKVTIQGSAKVGESVYGGGEIASVGRYKIKEGDNNPEGAPDWVLVGMPYSLANSGSGKCVVIIRDNAEIGPDNMQMTKEGGPDDSGHVIGAGKGVLPYEGFGVTDDDWTTAPWRMAPGDIKEYYTEAYYTEHSDTYEGHDYKADYFKYIETLALATETEVTIGGNAFVKGSVYGGSLNGHVQHDTKVTIQGGQIGAGAGMTEPYQETDWTGSTTPAGGWKACAAWSYLDNGAPYDPLATTSGTYDYTKYSFVDDTDQKSSSEGGLPTATDGHTYYGNVFGGGSGVIPYAPGLWHRGAGSVGGNIKVDITGGHILSNVYGGNECTDVGTYTKDSNGLSTATPVLSDPKGECVINISGGTIGVPRTDDAIKALPTIGHLYGGGKGDKRIFFNTWTNVIRTEVNITGNARIYGSTFGGGEDGHVLYDAETTIGGTVTIGTTGTSGYDGDVFGGGQGSTSALTAGVVGGNVTLSIQNGQVLGSVYGGGRIAAVGTFFENPDGDNYGSLQSDEPTKHGNISVNLTGGIISQNVFGGGMGTTDNTYGTRDGLAISRDVTVELNKDVDVDTKGCIVKGYIFGCNNVNSTPQGHAKVHIHATQNENEEKIRAKNDGYDVKGVFGGGNRADYVPEDATQSTEVIIEGCELTSIEEVYGGGYGAATPGTVVEIRGTHIINNVFGGGYGAGSSNPEDANYNPGANVGYRTDGNSYSKGEGKAVVQLMAGTVNNVYGGSNTKGDIRGGSSITTVEKTNEPGCCAELSVKEIYGGGKSADMEGGAEIVLGCMPDDWIGEIYAGAQKANVGHDVSLTITSGKFERVFGGNNESGNIEGYVEVNIEECPTCNTPIIIGELYGGGNMAPYTIDGSYTASNPNYPSPRVNVRSFTSIGTIYGGGLGSGAVVTGNPMVNINVGMVRGGGQNYAGADQAGTLDVKLYPHEKYKIGVIGNVFGGGNAAQVNGNTYVNIGVHEYELLAGVIAGETNVVGYYTRSGSGTESSPYEYNKVIVKAEEGTKYYSFNTSTKEYTEVEVVAGDDVSNYYTRSGDGTESSPYEYKMVEYLAVKDEEPYYMPVVGADIRGNVYGGGNEAEVTGDTNVNIGKKAK